jgi:acyl-CoA thioester hydrolase
MKRVTSAVVHPWACDIMGHLNTRHYVGMFDDAHYIILRELESCTSEQGPRLGWADVRNEIDYLCEVKAGAVVHLNSGIRSIGTKSLRVVTEMHAGDRRCARMCAIIVRFDLIERRSIPLSEEIKLAATGWLDRSPEGPGALVG